jgi:hypothetical protein
MNPEDRCFYLSLPKNKMGLIPRKKSLILQALFLPRHQNLHPAAVGHRLARVRLRRGVRQPEARMRRQQPDQLLAGVAGRADDGGGSGRGGRGNIHGV